MNARDVMERGKWKLTTRRSFRFLVWESGGAKNAHQAKQVRTSSHLISSSCLDLLVSSPGELTRVHVFVRWSRPFRTVKVSSLFLLLASESRTERALANFSSFHSVRTALGFRLSEEEVLRLEALGAEGKTFVPLLFLSLPSPSLPSFAFSSSSNSPSPFYLILRSSRSFWQHG